MRNVTVPVTMPEHIWGRLASIADRHNCRVADVVARALIASAATGTMPKSINICPPGTEQKEDI